MQKKKIMRTCRRNMISSSYCATTAMSRYVTSIYTIRIYIINFYFQENHFGQEKFEADTLKVSVPTSITCLKETDQPR